MPVSQVSTSGAPPWMVIRGLGTFTHVRLSGADRDVVGNVSAQLSQRGDQQGRGGLPVHVEIAPYADALAAVDRPTQALDGEQDFGHPRPAWQAGRCPVS